MSVCMHACMCVRGDMGQTTTVKNVDAVCVCVCVCERVSKPLLPVEEGG